jgi:hypothetical protein
MKMIMNVNPEEMASKSLQNVANAHSVNLTTAHTGKVDSQHDTLHAMK